MISWPKPPVQVFRRPFTRRRLDPRAGAIFELRIAIAIAPVIRNVPASRFVAPCPSRVSCYSRRPGLRAARKECLCERCWGTVRVPWARSASGNGEASWHRRFVTLVDLSSPDTAHSCFAPGYLPPRPSASCLELAGPGPGAGVPRLSRAAVFDSFPPLMNVNEECSAASVRGLSSRQQGSIRVESGSRFWGLECRV